jgi:hypothetical protein
MSSAVYIVRSPLHTLSQALLPENSSAMVLSLEDPLLPGKVLHVTNTTQFTEVTEGERLSYEQILEILLRSTKVIAL